MLGPLKRMWLTITRWVGDTRSYLFTVLHRGVRRIQTLLSTFLDRHQTRWISETTYRRTIVAAVVAVASTALPHPVTAAALGALLADQLPGRRWDPYDDEDDDPYPRRSPRLWETFQ